MPLLEKINTDELELLFERAIITRASLERGHIINDYIDMKRINIPVMDIYIRLSDKHNRSDYTIKNIVLNYFKTLS